MRHSLSPQQLMGALFFLHLIPCPVTRHSVDWMQQGQHNCQGVGGGEKGSFDFTTNSHTPFRHESGPWCWVKWVLTLSRLITPSLTLTSYTLLLTPHHLLKPSHSCTLHPILHLTIHVHAPTNPLTHSHGSRTPHSCGGRPGSGQGWYHSRATCCGRRHACAS